MTNLSETVLEVVLSLFAVALIGAPALLLIAYGLRGAWEIVIGLKGDGDDETTSWIDSKTNR